MSTEPTKAETSTRGKLLLWVILIFVVNAPISLVLSALSLNPIIIYIFIFTYLLFLVIALYLAIAKRSSTSLWVGALTVPASFLVALSYFAIRNVI